MYTRTSGGSSGHAPYTPRQVLPKHSPDMTAETAAETEEVTAETDEGEATEVTEMDTDDEALPSLGSWGHPELCRRRGRTGHGGTGGE